MTKYDEIIAEIATSADQTKAAGFQRFFKTAPGQYGFGDKFIGLTVPMSRKIAKKFSDLELSDTVRMLKSEVHEHRLIALFILIMQFDKGDQSARKSIYETYLDNIKHVNNWDLVDCSAPRIIGSYLIDKDRSILYKFAKSESLWERRIAIISTLEFIMHHQQKEAFEISEMLLNDKHDLIHKASGWMLREVGKRIDEKLLCEFLDKHSKKMPRTMLRYAIERLTADKKLFYMQK